MAGLLWKNTPVCAGLEDQYVKSKVYKSTCKSVYQVNLQKKHLCYANESGEMNYCYRLLLTTETTRSQNNHFCQISRPEYANIFPHLSKNSNHNV